MKKFRGGILLFLVLILALSSGSSYLALNQTTNSKNSNDEQKMTVALVNEDQGAHFHGKKYEFGDEFVKSAEKDDQRDWYVVSRGVAESGLQRNVYNMMIVIPNDFSQKALSIDSKVPEQVMLNYKINASDSSTMKPRAEKAASSILEDFNRRIIDVYFASVLGNLQNAQDNIRTLVNKEQQYANVYDGGIHRPLTGYTSQFGTVQDHSKIAQGSFSNLQDILKGFKTNLSEGVKTNSAYQSGINDFTKMKAANTLYLNSFSNQLGSLDSDMRNNDVLQQLDYLKAASKEINAQFDPFNATANIFSLADGIQKYIDTTTEKVKNYDTDLTNKLQADMKQSITDQLKNEIKTSTAGEQNVYLTNFFLKPDENAQKSIQKQIDRLPSLNPDDVDGLGFNEITDTQLKNVIAVTNKYISEFEYSPNRNTDRIPISAQVDQIKKDLQETGLTLADMVSLPVDKKNGQEFTLSIPDEYHLDQLLLTAPNHEAMDYTEDFYKNHKVVLPATDEGMFTVKLKVNLKEPDAKIDIFQPVTWGWKMDQKDVTAADTGELPKTEGQTSNSGANEQATAQGTIKPHALFLKAGIGNGTTGDQPSNPSAGGAANSSQAGQNPGDPNNNGLKDNTQPPVKVTNNYISHVVMSPLINDLTSVLINTASASVSDYQKMLMLYNLYFGIGMNQFDRPDLAEQLSQTSLKDIATEDSLYYLFNKQDIVDVLASYVAGQITEEVRQQTEDLKSKTDAYYQLVTAADLNSVQMANLIQATTNQGKVLNDNLNKTLDNLAAWRDASQNLNGDQLKISDANGEEQSVLLSLGSEFNSLLAASQSLADQSQSNLNTADQVYKTFNAIDTQAENIKNSGTNLVKQANDLSNNLTNKLTNDKNFADNFAGVLANSRIGDRPNENLLNFLSNPVQTKNAGVIATVDTFTPYFVVLICFIVALFTAYVISGYERRKQAGDSFAEERTLIGKNLPITIITAMIGVVEGFLIGWLSGYFLQIPQEEFIPWTGLITLIMAAMLLVAAYLLRQLKMFGMFILLVILSMYLFLTEALGLRYNSLSLAGKLREYSPLQYVEQLLLEFGNGAADHNAIVVWLLILIAASFAGHLFIFNGFAKNGEDQNEGMDQSL